MSSLTSPHLRLIFAAVLSHNGSGAVTMLRRLDDIVEDNATPDDFASGVWETWDVARAKADEALLAGPRRADLGRGSLDLPILNGPAGAAL